MCGCHRNSLGLGKTSLPRDERARLHLGNTWIILARLVASGIWVAQASVCMCSFFFLHFRFSSLLVLRLIDVITFEFVVRISIAFDNGVLQLHDNNVPDYYGPSRSILGKGGKALQVVGFFPLLFRSIGDIEYQLLLLLSWQGKAGQKKLPCVSDLPWGERPPYSPNYLCYLAILVRRAE
ncbi:unnamed protein product [Tuber aestivum]|uniref:Uncharacterized protein n=1 Tax=Tuber aestivum TaxID=59557 RepID=A0A292Q1W9_9PEZI|nr:unnamed protein product [Tuber aestivum]